jgi:hypothetical protein
MINASVVSAQGETVPVAYNPTLKVAQPFAPSVLTLRLCENHQRFPQRRKQRKTQGAKG